MASKPLRIVQISDIHLFSDKEKALLGVKTQASFQAVLDLLKKDPTQPDLLLLTGDLSQDETEAAYLRLAKQISEFSLPVYWIPGNHDDTKLLAHLFPRDNISNQKHIILERWHIILLNSQKTGSVEGYLDHAQLRFLQHCLDQYPEHHAIVVFHHQPVPVGCEWLDRLGLTNANELWELLAHYPRMHTIVFGHVHQQFEGTKNGIRYFSPPSTCIQFKPNSKEFALDNIPPGYRWIDIYPDGELKTGVCRAEKYVGTFDKNAKGY